MKPSRLDRACGGFVLGVAAGILVLAVLGDSLSAKSVRLVAANGLVCALVCALIPTRFIKDEE